MLKASGRSFYKASVPYPQVAGSPSRRTKNNTPLVERAKVWRGVELRSFGSLHRAATLCDRHRASMHVVLALLVSHPCETLGKHYHASLRLRSLGSARPCADFVRPLSCILCTFMNALLVSHPCETLGVHFIRHPCLTRKLRVLPPAAPKNNTPLVERGIIFGADGGGRTRTVLLPTDFESVTSANSITSAY